MSVGETNLSVLLRSMSPHLHDHEWVFCSVASWREVCTADTHTAASANEPMIEPLGMFRESEGYTLILTKPQAEQLGLNYHGTWAWIEITAHSALEAVGFLAALAARLAQAEISCNVISAYYHDHLFVQHAKAELAITVLRQLAAESA